MTSRAPVLLPGSPARQPKGEWVPTGLRISGRPIQITPHQCFACGTLNEHGLQLALHAEDGRCWTETSLADRFEGWQGIAHGGIVCTILDEVMAWALIETDAWGVTARLAVDFKRPVPIGRPIVAEGWQTQIRRRVFHAAGRVVDAETLELLATAEATYVAAPEDRKRELKARYGFSLRGEEANVNT